MGKPTSAGQSWQKVLQSHIVLKLLVIQAHGKHRDASQVVARYVHYNLHPIVANRRTLGPLFVIDNHTDGCWLSSTVDELMGAFLKHRGMQAQTTIWHSHGSKSPARILSLSLWEASLDSCPNNFFIPFRSFALVRILKKEAPRGDGLADLVFSGMGISHVRH